MVIRPLRLAALAAMAITLIPVACNDPEPLGGCVTDDECPQGLQCIAQACLPPDPCAAGIYIADKKPDVVDEETGEFPEDALIRQISGTPSGIALQTSLQNNILQVTAAEVPKLFAIDFYDDPIKNTGREDPIGVFMEARLKLLPGSQQCAAVIFLWPDRQNLAKFCLGGGRIGTAQNNGTSNNLIDDIDLEEFHTYRIDIKPATGELDAATGNAQITTFIEFWVDGERRLRLSPRDFATVGSEERPDRAPLLGFGVEGFGTTEWDYVRWGCRADSGICLPDLQNDDNDCATERRNTACNGDAVAEEVCDGEDNDCDAKADENFTENFAEGTPISIRIRDEDRYLGEECGLLPPCDQARVACSDDKLGLKCDTAAFAQPERCDTLDNDCDSQPDEDFSIGGDPSKLWADETVGEAGLGLGERCGFGDCENGTVVCNNNQDGVTCSSHVNRLETDICDDGRDNNCNNEVDEGNDQDGDGFQNCVRCGREPCVKGHDCNDSPGVGADIFPGQEETCNRQDDDCDGRIDEGLDQDGDTYLPCGVACLEGGSPTVCGVDCDDNPEDDEEGQPRARDIFPGATELCDGVDNNCQSGPDEDFSSVVDGRRFYTNREHCGACGVNCDTISEEMNTLPRCEILDNGSQFDQYACSPRCKEGFVDSDEDILASEPNWHEQSTGCNCETDEEVFCNDPQGLNCTENCDGRDNDCDGRPDEAEGLQMPLCYTGPPNTRNLGICHDGRVACQQGMPQPDICRGEQTPVAAAERACDGLDEDCDGQVDDGNLDDGSACQTGLDGVCAAGTLRCREGAQRCIPNTPQNQIRETCDLIDNDCDGQVDEDTDADGDGFEPCRACVAGEQPQAGVNFCVDDCNDNPQQGGRRINPVASETCNGEDDDCDRYVDEEFVIRNGQGEPIDAQRNVVIGTSVGLIYNSEAHCGTCGTACAPANGLGNCDTGVCRLVECRQGFLNLDEREDNGCEASDCRLDNVGAQVNLIGQPCDKPMYDEVQACRCTGTYQCLRRGGIPAVECIVIDSDEGDIIPPAECIPVRRSGVEVETCDIIDNDCDGQVDETFILKENGRPVLDNEGEPIYSDVSHCGVCNRRCAPPNVAFPICNRGACEFDQLNDTGCAQNFHDIDGRFDTGCEYACTSSGREVCDGIDNDCDDLIDQGFNLQTDVNNCGVCGRRCEFAHGVGTCTAGVCRLASCSAGFDDCNDIEADGCETDLNNPATCGSCVNRCDTVATSGCTNQRCVCGQLGPCVMQGATVCDDLAGECTGCLDNGDCAAVAGRPFCVDNACRQCEPITHAGCEENAAAPICVDGSCQTCLSDAQCTIRPGNRDTCLEGTGRCQLCDPATNSGCGGNNPTCDAATFTCRPCNIANPQDCLGGACVGGRCSGCDVDTHVPCVGASPICDPVATECQPCDNDAECLDKDPGTPQCVAGRCQICDPADHTGCLGTQLCCGFQCVNTNPDTQCEGCGQRCNPASTSTCNARDCDCGMTDECGAQTAFCNDPTGLCVNCRADADCGGLRPECVGNSCETCDPAGNVRCGPLSGQPICDPASKICRRCGADADCRGANAANFEGGECIADGSCRTCDPANNAGCLADSVRPICRTQDNVLECRSCINNQECSASPRGNVCSLGSGRCTPCANQAECAGHHAGNLCNLAGAPATCGMCQNSGQCANHPAGNRCVAGNCTACQVSADCAGNPAGNTCVAGRCAVCEAGTNAGCDGQTPICGGGACRACQNNGECGANRFCVEAAVEGIQAASAGTCQRCDPVGDTGCDPNSAAPVCDPLNFFCRVCAVDAECGANKQCFAGRCEVCDPGTDDGCAPGGATPICRGNPPACTACQANGECAENIRNGDICVGGSCVECNVAGHAGCAADELCCNDGGGARCVGTGPDDGEVCTACNVNGCNANDTNQCVNRACRCGPNAACAADRICANGNCVQCVLDADCPNQTPACVNNQCKACDLADDQGCGGQTPVCVLVANNQTCVRCDTADNSGCGAGTPICTTLNNVRTCVQCTNNAQCPNGQVCDANICLAAVCDPNTGAGCAAGQSCINNGGVPRCQACGPACAAGQVCQTVNNAPVCECNPLNNTGCAVGQACVDPPATRPVCQACVGCGANELCSNVNNTPACTCNNLVCPGALICVSAAGALSCEICDRATDRGCAAPTPECIPDGAGSRCAECDDATDCPGARPVCQNNVCVAAACNVADGSGCAAGQSCISVVGVPTCRACNPACGAGQLCKTVNNLAVCQCNPATNTGCAATEACTQQVGQQPLCSSCNPACGENLICANVNQSAACRCNGVACAGQDICVDLVAGDRCAECDPASDRNCGGITPQCVNTNNVFDCERCDPGNDAGCIAPTPQCISDGTGGFECVECENNGQCPQNEPVCIDNECTAAACNPQDGSGCAAGSSCIDVGGVPTCRACNPGCGMGEECITLNNLAVCRCDLGENTGCPANQACLNLAGGPACRACNPACGTTGSCANVNDQSVCRCGDAAACAANLHCAPDGQGAFSCEVCNPSTDGGCAGGAPQCVNNAGVVACEVCDPTGDAGCVAPNAQCISDGVDDFRCKPCDPTGDVGCVAPTAQCVDQGGGAVACERCDPDGNVGCLAADPLCVEVAGDLACRDCDPTDDEPCAAPTTECVENAGVAACQQCDPTNDSPCVNHQDCLAVGGALTCRALLVINEVEYDQPGAPDDHEFVEIHNVSGEDIDLTDLRLQVISNAGDIDAVIALTDGIVDTMLPADGYLVIANQAIIDGPPALPMGTITVSIAPDSLGNGVAGLRIFKLTGSEVIDSLSYEGVIAGTTEGANPTPSDTGANGQPKSIARCANGADSNRNSADFLVRDVTPGATNDCP